MQNFLQSGTTAVILVKSKNSDGVGEKKHDFEISRPSCRMCCTTRVKSCSTSLIP